MTLPKPPLPRNCSSSNSHLTRDFPGTPEKKEKSGTGSSCSGWSTRNDGPSFPTTPLFLSAPWGPFGKPFGKPFGITGVMKECSSNWEADQRFLSWVFRQLWEILTKKWLFRTHFNVNLWEARWLARLTPHRVAWVRVAWVPALGVVIALCFWARQLTLTMPLFTQVHINGYPRI